MARQRPDNLKQALVDEAFIIIEKQGVEQLSLRAVARRLGVSHQAPYKHFPSRDHILAAVVARCFENFADHLNAREKGATPEADLRNMGLAYLSFAMEHPLKYRLMFNTPLPPAHEHQEMLANAQYAFSLLKDKLETMVLRDPGDALTESEKHDALFVWSTLHGLASLMQSGVIETLELTEGERTQGVERLMRRLGFALKP